MQQINLRHLNGMSAASSDTHSGVIFCFLQKQKQKSLYFALSLFIPGFIYFSLTSNLDLLSTNFLTELDGNYWIFLLSKLCNVVGISMQSQFELSKMGVPVVLLWCYLQAIEHLCEDTTGECKYCDVQGCAGQCIL